MAILEMKRIKIYVHFKERFRVFEKLQQLKIFEFLETNIDEEIFSGQLRRERLAYESAQFDQIITFLEKYEKKKGLVSTLKYGAKDEFSLDEVRHYFLYTIKNKIDISAKNIEDKIVDTKARIKKIKEEYELLIEWKDLSIDFSLLKKLKKIEAKFFIVNEKDKAYFLNEIDGFKDCVYEVINNNVAIIYYKEDENQINKILTKFNLKSIDFDNVTTTISKRINFLSDSINKLNKELLVFEDNARDIARQLPYVRAATQFIHWEEEKQTEIIKGKSTREILFYEGWIPKKFQKFLNKELSQTTPLYAIEDVDCKDKELEDVPVEIENKKIFRPFESVTKLYGLPSYKDIDPTAFLAGFFFLFFGFALSDVGYGLILAITSLLLIKYTKLPKDTKKLILLLATGGISAVIFGLIFGGYLGIPEEYIPSWLIGLKKLDPLTSPIQVLLLSLFLGVIQIVVGLLLNIYKAKKNKDFKNGLLDNGPWVYIFISIFLVILNSFGYIPDFYFPYTYFVYFGVILLIVTQGRKEKSIFKKLFKGVFSLYDSVGFFSDILSYSRLLALGLATTAISFAVDTIAIIIKDLVPVVGFVLMIAILIVGHIFNLAVNTLGAFIHGARLQFVEFFTKFITGTGRAFKPFAKDERFIILKD